MSPKKKLKIKKNQKNVSLEKSLKVPDEDVPIILPYQQEQEIPRKKAAKRKRKDCKFLNFKPSKTGGKHIFCINVSIKIFFFFII